MDRVTVEQASSHLGTGIQDSSSGEGGGQSWRGVDEASTEVRLNNMAGFTLVMYLMEFEVRQKEHVPEFWSMEPRACGRAEGLVGTQEGAVSVY